MGARLSRRSVLHGLASLPVAGLAASASQAFAQLGKDSGGLGLTQAEWEAVFGPGQPGQSFLYYLDPATGAEMHVGYDNGVIDYYWISFGDSQLLTGIEVDLAMKLIDSLMPVDARLRETYVANESPGSLARVETWRMTSRWLDDQLDGRASYLVSLTVAPNPNGGGDTAVRATAVVEERA
jgi:hypothetical protein